MLSSRRIDWRSQRGSSLMMLLMVWGVLIGSLGVAFDLAMSYVYRQQIRTAMEAGVTAGAHKGEYRMQVRLYRRHYLWVHDCVPFTNPDGTPGCAPRKRLTVTKVDTADSQPNREEVIWAPYRYWKPRAALWTLHPTLCQPQRDDGAYVYCERAEVIKESCRVAEISPGAAVNAARDAYDANKTRWGDKLRVLVDGNPQLIAEGLRFEVTMEVRAEMPTMFLRMIGIPTIPIRVLGTELGDHAAKIVRLGDDPCRS